MVVRTRRRRAVLGGGLRFSLSRWLDVGLNIGLGVGLLLGACLGLGGCVPDDVAPEDGPEYLLFVEGYVDPALGARIRLREATPLGEALEGLVRPMPVDGAAVRVVDDGGAVAVELAPGPRGIYERALRGEVTAGQVYTLEIDVGERTFSTRPAVVPEAPQLRVDPPRRGSFGVDRWDVSAVARMPFAPGFAIVFEGDPAGGLFGHPCNQAAAFGYLSGRCAAVSDTATLLLGFFADEAVGDSLRTTVTSVPEGLADYASVTETNEFNWERVDFVYLDPLVLPTNVVGGYGYVSFQHTATVSVRTP